MDEEYWNVHEQRRSLTEAKDNNQYIETVPSTFDLVHIFTYTNGWFLWFSCR